MLRHLEEAAELFKDGITPPHTEEEIDVHEALKLRADAVLHECLGQEFHKNREWFDLDVLNNEIDLERESALAQAKITTITLPLLAKWLKTAKTDAPLLARANVNVDRALAQRRVCTPYVVPGRPDFETPPVANTFPGRQKASAAEIFPLGWSRLTITVVYITRQRKAPAL